MPPQVDQPRIWVLQTSFKGDTNNRLAIARAISPDNHQLILPKAGNYDPEQVVLHYTGAERLEDVQDWPDMFLICEQETSKYGRAIKQLSGGKTFIVGVQTPDIDSNDFDNRIGDSNDYHTDMQVVWRHHKTAAPGPETRNLGIYRHVAADVPTPINAETLADAMAELPPELAKLRGKRPIITVAMGSLIDADLRFQHSNWYHDPEERALMQDNLRDLMRQITDVAKKTGGAVLLTTSHRTHRRYTPIIAEHLADTPHVFYNWKTERGANNPYRAMLALADQIVVTSDSLSMTADALATGKPVFSFVGREAPGTPPDKRLSEALATTKMIKPPILNYLLGQAEDGRLRPMADLGKRRLKAKPPVDAGPAIGTAVKRSFDQFRRNAEHQPKRLAQADVAIPARRHG